MKYRIIYGDGDYTDGFEEKDLEELLKDIESSAKNAECDGKELFVVKVESPF